MNIDDKQIAEALDRIGRTPDGVALYLFLQKALTALPTDTSGDALREFHGRRTFAAELMFMLKDGVRDNAGSDPTDRPIVFVRAEPVRTGGRQRPRDFLSAIEPDVDRRASGDNAGSTG